MRKGARRARRRLRNSQVVGAQKKVHGRSMPCPRETRGGEQSRVRHTGPRRPPERRARTRRAKRRRTRRTTPAGDDPAVLVSNLAWRERGSHNSGLSRQERVDARCTACPYSDACHDGHMSLCPPSHSGQSYPQRQRLLGGLFPRLSHLPLLFSLPAHSLANTLLRAPLRHPRDPPPPSSRSRGARRQGRAHG